MFGKLTITQAATLISMLNDARYALAGKGHLTAAVEMSEIITDVYEPIRRAIFA